jgi:hypothetical protein
MPIVSIMEKYAHMNKIKYAHFYKHIYFGQIHARIFQARTLFFGHVFRNLTTTTICGV